MAITMGFGIGVGLLINLVLPLALVIFLQIWMCKKGGKLGLILPVLSFVVSLVLCIGIGAFAMFGTGGATYMETTDPVTGTVIWEERHDEDHHQTTVSVGAMGSIVVLFLVSNIPTVTFYGIWKAHRKDYGVEADLKKMQAADLE